MTLLDEKAIEIALRARRMREYAEIPSPEDLLKLIAELAEVVVVLAARHVVDPL